MSRAAVVAAAFLLVAPAAGVGWAQIVDASAAAASVDDAPPDATIDHEGDRLTLEAAGGQVVRGNTTLEPGANVEVRIRATGGKHPFLERARAIVQPDGEFVVVFGLDDARPGTNFTVTVWGPDGGRIVDELPGRVVEGDVDIGLPESRVSVQRGGTSTLSVHLDRNANATFALLGRETVYRLIATVSDGDGDGVVDVRFDTAVAGTDGNTISAGDSADEVTLVSESSLDSALPPGGYVVLLGIEETESASTATPTSTDPPTRSGQPEVSPHVSSVLYGRTDKLSVALGDASGAILSIGGSDVNYVVNASVRDGNGDGVVDVRFDTAAPATDRPTLSAAADADEVTVTNETDIPSSRALAPGNYPVRLHRGGDVSGPTVSTATVEIEDLTLGIEEARLRIGTVIVEGETRTATPTQSTPPASGSPAFEDTVMVSYAGETAELRFLLGDASAATVSIGGDSVNYVVNATVRDGNGDNQVVLVFDTSAAGTDRPTLSAAADADTVTVTRETDLASPPLDPGEYPVTVFEGDDASGEAVDIASIILEEGRDRSPTPTATPTTTVSPTAAVGTSSSVDPGVVALGGIAVVGLGAAALLSRKRRWL